MSETVNFKGQDYSITRKGTRFVSFYSTIETPEKYLRVEHKAEGPAAKGSWQTPAMKKIFVYRGYAAV